MARRYGLLVGVGDGDLVWVGVPPSHRCGATTVPSGVTRESTALCRSAREDAD